MPSASSSSVTHYCCFLVCFGSHHFHTKYIQNHDMHLLSQLKDEHGLGMHGIVQAELLTAQKLRASFNGSQSS